MMVASSQSTPKPQSHVFQTPTVKERPRPSEPAGVSATW